MWKGLGIVSTFGLVACVISGCGPASREAAGSNAAPMVVQAGAVEPITLLTGELAAEQATVVSAPAVNVWPLTVRWVIEDGTTVKAGDRLLEFDNQTLTSSLEDLEARLVEAETALSAAEADAQSTQRDALLEVARRQAALDKAEIAAEVPAEMVSARDYDQLQTALEKARVEAASAADRAELGRQAGERQIEVKRVALGRVRNELAEARSALGALVLTAPAAGVALVADARRESRRLQAGDEVWPGYVVVRIPELDTLVVRALLYDVDDGAIAPGDAAEVTLDALPGSALSGTVRQIGTIAREVGSDGQRRAFRVTVDVSGLDPDVMRPGMSAKVVIAGRRVEGLVAPRSAIVWGSAETRLRRPGGTEVPVDLGPCDAFACVVESGAESGLTLAAEDDA